MLFKRPALALLAALAAAQHACGAKVMVTSSQVVTSIKAVTTASQTLNTALGTISTTTTSTQLATVATTVTTGFTNIVSSVANAVTMIGTAPPFDADGSKLVVDALLTFVKIHQALLSTVIGKHAIFAQFGLTAPFAAVLRTLEAGVDAFAVALIALIPTKMNTAKNAFQTLDASVDNCIKTYNEVCLPSIFYPSTMPICVSF